MLENVHVVNHMCWGQYGNSEEILTGFCTFYPYVNFNHRSYIFQETLELAH